MTPRLPPGKTAGGSRTCKGGSSRHRCAFYRFIAGHLDSAGVVKAWSPGTVATTVR